MNTHAESAGLATPVGREPARAARAAERPSTRVETEVWTGRPSQVANLGTFIWCGLFCWLVVPVFVAVWRYLLVRTMRYEVTTQRFRITHGVLARRTDEVELYRIKDTTLTQTLFQRLFGLGTVAMATSDASTPLVGIDSVPAGCAKELREQIRNLVEDLRESKRVREIDYA